MKNYSFVVLFLFFGLQINAQSDSIRLLSLKAHVQVLANDSLEGRATGSTGEKLANAYLISQFIAKRRKAKTVSWKFEIVRDSAVVKSEMIGSFIDNKAKQTLLIGAHIDHIGYGGELSKSIGKHEIHNGADDNASGVAILIELQKHFVNKKLPFNILFVAFSGHEIGTYGSAYLSENLGKEYGDLFCMLNLDMLGRMENKKILISSSDTLVNSFHSNELTSVQMDDTRLRLLDTKNFLTANIPCATFTTGIHNDYHKTSDDIEYINFEGMFLTLTFLENWINTNASKFLK